MEKNQTIVLMSETDKPLLDLAVEVNYTPCSIVNLDKYKDLGIKEVWMWQDNKITFYHLVDSQYQKVENSVCLPKLSADFLVTFINRELTETPLTIEEDFYRQLS